MFFTLSVLSLLVAMSTFRLLTLPAVTLTEDPNTMEASDPASSEASPSGGDAEGTDEAAGDAAAGTETDSDAGDTGAEPGTDPGDTSGTEPGTEEGNTPGTEPGTEEGNAPGTEPGTEEGNTPGTEPGTEEGNTPGTEPGTEEGNTPGTEPGTEEGNTPGTEPGTEEGNTPGTEPGTEEGKTPGTEPGGTSGTETGTDAGNIPGTEPVPGTETGKIPDPEIPLDGLIPAPEEIQPAEYTYDDGNGLSVTAVPEDPTSIPVGAEFRADRITQESDPERYAQYQELLEEKNGPLVSPTFNAYDIYFLIEGERVEPDSGTVSVTIVDTTEAAIARDDATVFHVLNEDTAPTLETLSLGDSVADTTEASIDAADADQGITFTTDSFSAFLTMSDTSDSSNLFRKGTVVLPTDYTFEDTKFYDSSQFLGIAGNFSLVAFNTMYINNDCNGNILANTLKFGNGKDFGTKNLTGSSDTGGYGEVSYIQNYAPGCDSNGPCSSDLLVLGSDNTVEWSGNQLKIDTHLVSKPTTVWQVAKTSRKPFIDLGAVEREAKGLSSSLSAITNNPNATLMLPGEQPQNTGVKLTLANGVGVYNIKATDLVKYYKDYFGVFGLTFNDSKTALTGGTMIINVDCNGWDKSTAFNMPVCKIYPEAGDPLEFHEVTTFTNGRVLWNFANCDGMKINTQLAYCSILAPGADITVKQNLNGTVIGNNVTIEGENHRDDFGGELPKSCSYTVNKVWENSDGTPLTADLTGWSVKVQLLENGKPVREETLDNDNYWTCTWYGLKGDNYTVSEIAVNLNGDTSEFTPTYDYDIDGDGCTITNTKTTSYELPDTGGPGTYLYTVTGLSLLLLSSVLLWRQKRQGRDAA